MEYFCYAFYVNTYVFIKNKKQEEIDKNYPKHLPNLAKSLYSMKKKKKASTITSQKKQKKRHEKHTHNFNEFLS